MEEPIEALCEAIRFSVGAAIRFASACSVVVAIATYHCVRLVSHF